MDIIISPNVYTKMCKKLIKINGEQIYIFKTNKIIQRHRLPIKNYNRANLKLKAYDKKSIPYAQSKRRQIKNFWDWFWNL